MDNIFKRLVEGMFEGDSDDLNQILNDENLKSSIQDQSAEFWSKKKRRPLFGNKKKSKTTDDQTFKDIPVVNESEGFLYDLQSLGIDFLQFPVDLPDKEPYSLVICFKNEEMDRNEFANLMKQVYNYQLVKMKPIQLINELDVCKSKIKEIPRDISRLINLHAFDLSENKIKEIPKEIGFLKKILYLALDNNQISHIPSEIGRLQNLEHFSITENNLFEIPNEIFQLSNLIFLGLSFNRLTTLSSNIQHLKNLRTLYLDDNKIKSLPKEILELPNLQVISCFYNPLDDNSLNLLSQLLQINPEIQLNMGKGLGNEFLDSVQYERKKAA